MKDIRDEDSTSSPCVEPLARLLYRCVAAFQRVWDPLFKFRFSVGNPYSMAAEYKPVDSDAEFERKAEKG